MEEKRVFLLRPSPPLALTLAQALLLHELCVTAVAELFFTQGSGEERRESGCLLQASIYSQTLGWSVTVHLPWGQWREERKTINTSLGSNPSWGLHQQPLEEEGFNVWVWWLVFFCFFFFLLRCMEALQLFSLPSIYALGLCYLVTRDKQGVEKMLFKK